MAPLLLALLLPFQSPASQLAPGPWQLVTRCAGLRLHGRDAGAQACYQSLAASDDPYLQAEGAWGLDDYAQANDDFRRAVAVEDSRRASLKNPPVAPDLARDRWGRLLQARFNDADAEGLFKEALQRDPNDAQAYLGLALVSADGFDGKALDYAHRAVALDPALAEAHVLLAMLALEDSDPATASAEAALALQSQPDDLDAMAVQAAIAAVASRSPDADLARVFAINPHYGQADEIVADQLVLNRRYSDAVDYYRKAIALDPQLWSAHSALGITLMRLGQTDQPRRELILAYNNDYRDVATVNTLRLLDTLDQFATLRQGNVILKFDKKESAVLAPYFFALVQRALIVYSAKYQMTLPAPVQVEVYSNHADFAVRSVGLPGLGALGVTFGEVVAMDSPSARPPGDFNWGTTLWHELDHVFVLTATHHLVPRWFAEGLAVHEETQPNPPGTPGALGAPGPGPEWGDRITPEVLAAIRDRKLLPIASLDQGFVHPTYPDQVNVSYFQAGRVCDFIQDKWGAAKLVEMVHDFAVPATTAAVVQQALGLAPSAFDRQFQAWLMAQVGAEVNGFDQWRTDLKAMVAAKDPAQVIQLGNQAIALYPGYIYDANAYNFVANAYLARHEDAAAVRVLTQYEHEGGMDPQTLKQLAALEPPAAAAATLNRLNFIYPLDAGTHRKLGDLYLQLFQTSQTGEPAGGRPGGEAPDSRRLVAAAIREFTAVVNLHPLDIAGAQYDLARADFAAGKLDDAQNAVIASLVAAHDYRPAQDLLVQIMAAKH